MEPGFAEVFHNLLAPELVFVYWLALGMAGWAALKWARRRAVNRSNNDLCPVCGYVVDRIGGSTCPECGTDLLRSGVIPPGGRRSTETFALVVRWTVLLPLLGLVGSAVLGQLIHHYAASGTVRLTPRSRAFSYVQLAWSGEGYRRPFPVRTLQLELVNVPPGRTTRTVHMKVGPATGAYRYEDDLGAVVTGPTLPDAAALVRWMRLAEVEVDSPEAAPVAEADARDLSAVVRAAAKGNLPEADTPRLVCGAVTRHEDAQGPDPHFRAAALFLWSLVWLAGVQAILWSRHRGQAALRASDPAPDSPPPAPPPVSRIASARKRVDAVSAGTW